MLKTGNRRIGVFRREIRLSVVIVGVLISGTKEKGIRNRGEQYRKRTQRKGNGMLKHKPPGLGRGKERSAYGNSV